MASICKHLRPLKGCRRRPAEYIFILSAMRSGSTLLQHLVCQQEDMLSAGETKIEYHGLEDLARLRAHLLEYNDRQADDGTRYRCVEKCVHNGYFPRPLAVATPEIRFIFLLRDPVAAVSSLLERKGWPYAESVESAVWYYNDRFTALVSFARLLQRPEDAVYIGYEDFLGGPSRHLRRLSGFLGLDQELTESYPKQKWTARLSLGDVSPNIHSRKIVPNERKELAEIPRDLEAGLRATHAWAVRSLTRACRG